MDRVTVRTKALSQALFSLAVAGCETIEVSVVAHALKVEGIKGEETLILHVWSKDAEDTEASVGIGEPLTEAEVDALDKGECPKCQKQLRKGPKAGLAINVSCDDGHCFWVPPAPFTPEYLGQPAKEVEEEAIRQDVDAEQEAARDAAIDEAQAEGETEADKAAEQAIEALEKGEADEVGDTG